MKNGIGRHLKSFAGALGGLALLVSSSCGNNFGGNGGGVVCNFPYMRNGSGCCLDQNGNGICDSDEGNNGGGNRYNIDAGRYSGTISCSSSLDERNTDYLSIAVSGSGIPYVSSGDVYSVGDSEQLFVGGISGESTVTYVGDSSLLPGALEIRADAVFSNGNESIYADVTYLIVSCGQNLPESCNDSRNVYFGGHYGFENGEYFDCEGELYKQ